MDDLAPMGVLPDSAFEDMINVLCKAGRVKEACKLADGIIDRGREIPARVWTVLINASRKAGNADLAIKLLHSKIGIGYTSETFNVIPIVLCVLLLGCQKEAWRKTEEE
ncbi:hypothetical protein MRB53_021832 [Persea americana]|uniref:Uncharacterized protein n=1 Tax=Persea americana TaxID=3435 RepID=A0ACC2L5B7_PERAE|nr:hypothetical protein MRB53_021832 [Persea americana]